MVEGLFCFLSPVGVLGLDMGLFWLSEMCLECAWNEQIRADNASMTVLARGVSPMMRRGLRYPFFVRQECWA
jgi:hypothetical protein